MPVPLLTTKLFVPPARPDLVPRPRLTQRLNEGMTRKLTLLSAPAGYGKTTLLAQWIADWRLPIADWELRPGSDAPIVNRQSKIENPPVAWLSLDEGDNDPVRFLTYLVASLQGIEPHIGQAAQAMLQSPQPPPPEAFLTSLINDIAATPTPFVLVLDDYHLIHTLPIHQQLAFLLEHQPPQMHLVIATREDPPLPLSRWRGRGQVLEIRQDDLRFSQEECADFLQRVMRLALSPADVAALQQRTEGWIAGLQLAALSLQGRDDARQFVQSFTGSHRYVLDYLMTEVFQRQPADVQDFLRKTSILDRLTASLCDAVAEREDSRQMLSALEQANLFIVPLDESQQWYRYHRLFRDLLRTQREGLAVAALHQRAARWFEQHGFLYEAMDHLLAAEDWDEAERLMEGAATQAINHGQFATLNRWLDALPETRLRGSPELAALKGWGLLMLGQLAAARTWVDLAENLLRPDAPLFRQALVACLRIYLAQIQSDIPQVIVLAQRALALLEAGDPHGLRGAALFNLASAQAVTGDIPAATQTFRELARLGQERGHPISAVSAWSNLAWLAHLQGQTREAVVLGHQALELGVDTRGNPLPLAGQAHLALGLIYYDLNELAPAQEHLAQGLELSRQLSPTSGAMQAAFTLARIQYLRGETETAQATVASTRRAAAALNLPLADALAAAYEADFQLALGNVEAAARWAETAGLSPTDSPVFLREAEYCTYARLLLAQNRPAEARTLLANLERYARSGGLVRSLITVGILQARAQQALGQKEPALARLAEAVHLAAGEGYRRAFLDEGEPIRLLIADLGMVQKTAKLDEAWS
jgi:LuxR family maltose regulon positive regulatory protein